MTEDMALTGAGAFKKNVDEIVALLIRHGADVKADQCVRGIDASSRSITRAFGGNHPATGKRRGGHQPGG